VLQVRSLHDMVRAMPLPKSTNLSASSTTGRSGSPGRRSPAGSSASGVSSSVPSQSISHSRSRLSHPSDPNGVSPGRSAPSVSTLGSPERGSQQGHRGTQPESPLSKSPGGIFQHSSNQSTATGSSLNMPSLKFPRARTSGPEGELSPPPSMIRERSLSPSNRLAASHKNTGRASERTAKRSSQQPLNRDDSLATYVTATSQNAGFLSHSVLSPVSPDSESASNSRLHRQDVAAPISPRDLTRVFLAPQFIPKTAPLSSEASQLLAMRSSNATVAPSTLGKFQKDDLTYSYDTTYDAEENLVLANTLGGIDTSSGIKSPTDHDSDPVPWNQYNQLMIDQSERTSDVSTSIMVVQPYDIRHEHSQQARMPMSISPEFQTSTPPPRYKEMTSSWGSSISEVATASGAGGVATSSYTSVEDRMACLLRAKAILEAHREFMDSPTVQLEGTNTAYEPSPPPEKGKNAKEQRQLSTDTQAGGQQDLGNDDGLAPLGGVWPTNDYDTRVVTPKMLMEPEKHMLTIQSCAVRFLKVCLM
jgi:hypothetical protein